MHADPLVRCRHHDLELLGVVLVAFVFGAIDLAGVAFTDVVGECCFTINPEGAEYYLISKLHRRLAARPLISELGIAQVLNAVGILGVQLELEPLHLAAIDPLGHLRRPRARGLLVRKRRAEVVADCYGRNNVGGRILSPVIEVSATVSEVRRALLFYGYCGSVLINCITINTDSQEVGPFNWCRTNLYMYFVNGLIKGRAFLIDRNFNKVEVVIARLVVRARINENLSVFIDGSRGRSLASVFVKRAVLIPEWCPVLLYTSDAADE